MGPRYENKVARSIDSLPYNNEDIVAICTKQAFPSSAITVATRPDIWSLSLLSMTSMTALSAVSTLSNFGLQNGD